MARNQERRTISCLDMVLREIRSAELTQQIKLTDGMPDIGRVLSAWGQVILRGKEWRDEEVSINGGMMVWVLYEPEDGSKECWIDGWIPFQMKWDLPEDLPEGTLRIHCLSRFVDGRSVSPRKIMVRCGVSAMAEAYVPMERELLQPEADLEKTELLENAYPMQLLKEAGERTFFLDEDLTLPDSQPQPEKLIWARLEPGVSECRVLADKLAFRGNGNLRILYRSEEGKLHSFDFSIPYSQVAELAQEYGGDAKADLAAAVTNLETDVDEEGHIRLKCGIAGQYRIRDRELVSLVEDAYSPEYETTVHKEMLELPVVLESRQESLSAECDLPTEVPMAVELTFLPTFPREKQEENTAELEYAGVFQTLFYDSEGKIASANTKWAHKQKLNADADCVISMIPVSGESQLQLSNGQLQAKADLRTICTVTAKQQIPMVTAVELGQKMNADPNRPSLILRRAGTGRLWDIAKGSGSTVADIRLANDLTGEPAPDRLLLIPIK